MDCNIKPMYGILICLFVFGLQKWSKGKVRDKLNNLILFDKATYDKFSKEVPTYKLITPSVVSERMKIRGSLAKQALRALCREGKSQPRFCNRCILFNYTIDVFDFILD